MARSSAWCVWFVIAAFAAIGCGGDSGSGGNNGDTADGGDVDPGDTTSDAEPDAEPDVAPDTEPDVVPDAEPDAEPDVDTDAAPDADGGDDVAVDVDAGDDANTDDASDAVDVDADDDTETSDADDASDADDSGDIDASDDADTSDDVADTDVGDDPDAGGEWALPTCDEITGTAAVTLTLDEGSTTAPTDGTLSGFVYTNGLVALDVPDTFVAHSGGTVYRSEDSGCTWFEVGPTTETVMRLTAGVGDEVFAWEDNNDGLYRIRGMEITPLASPADNIMGVGVDRSVQGTVAVADSLGNLTISTNSGDLFGRWNSGPPVEVPLGYRVTFDPNDIEHILYGRATTGVWHTDNGGETWTQATGLSDTVPDGRANVFNIVISPADGDIAWAAGIDISEELSDPESNGKYIYRSEDGGLTWEKVEEDSAEITITNGPLMAAHPTDTDVFYWSFGTCFSGYGTDLYRYDHGTGMTTAGNEPYAQYGAFAFHPADPSYLFIGIDSEAFALCE